MEVIPDIIETVDGRNVTIMCNVTANPKPGPSLPSLPSSPTLPLNSLDLVTRER